MRGRRVTLKEAVRFHGHLGPYLILGVLAGEAALRNLGCKKYFGLNVRVQGANKRPKSCLIDGLQLSTGATYGKANIIKLNGSIIKIIFENNLSHKKLALKLKKELVLVLKSTITHRDSESLAKKIFRTPYSKLFIAK